MTTFEVFWMCVCALFLVLINFTYVLHCIVLMRSIEDGHVIPGLIHKCYNAKKDGKQ